MTTNFEEFTKTIQDNASAFTEDVKNLWTNFNTKLKTTFEGHGFGEAERKLFLAEILEGKITDHDTAIAYLQTKGLEPEQLAEFTAEDFANFKATVDNYDKQRSKIKGFIAEQWANFQELDGSTQGLVAGGLAGLTYAVANPGESGIFSGSTLIKAAVGAAVVFGALKGFETISGGENDDNNEKDPVNTPVAKPEATPALS